MSFFIGLLLGAGTLAALQWIAGNEPEASQCTQQCNQGRACTCRPK